MHLKQQNNLLIGKIWTTENFPQEASSGSPSFHPVLGNKKKWLQRKLPVKFWAEGEHYHYVVCYAFQFPADLTKSEKIC